MTQPTPTQEEPETFSCDNCAEDTNVNERQIVQGNDACLSCVEEHTFTCEDCHNVFWVFEEHELDGNPHCQSCYEYAVVHCNHCNTELHRDNPENRHTEYAVYCSNRCFNRCAFFCGGCGDSFEIDDGYEFEGERYCGYCIEEIDRNASANTYYTDETKNFSTRGYTIGIELEVYPEGTVPSMPVELTKYFGVKPDGSLSSNGVEYVSVPTNNDNAYEIINGISDFLISNNFRVNTDCGFHLHIGGDKISNSVNRQKIMIGALIFKDCLFNMLPPSRQNNTYCDKTRLPLNSLLFTKKAQNNPEEIYNNYCCRYEFLNYRAFDRHGTLENRAHQGTINSKKILNWIEINTRLFDFAINTSYEDLIKLRGNAIEFKREVLKDKELINYYEQRVKKFKRKTVRKRRSVYHGIRDSLKRFKPDVQTKITEEKMSVDVKFNWQLRYGKVSAKDLLPVMKKDFDNVVKEVDVKIDY